MTDPSNNAPTSTTGTTGPVRLAGCVILDDQGRILLLHRNTTSWCHWELPGGSVKTEIGEEDAVAAAREAHEELDVDVLIERCLGQGVFTENGTEMVFTWYLANIVAGTPAVQEPHLHDGLRYFEIDKLREMHGYLSSNMRVLVNELFADRVKL